MDTFKVLDELIEIAGSTDDELRRKSVRRHVLIGEIEALGACRVAVDSSECLKQTHARETVKLVVLTKVMAETQAGIHENKPQDYCSTEVPEDSGNPNSTAFTSNPPADQMETLTVETPIPTVSLPVPTAYFTDSQEPSSDTRLI
nr:hypothetical protein [Tanacetum cinerariifolium]